MRNNLIRNDKRLTEVQRETAEIAHGILNHMEDKEICIEQVRMPLMISPQKAASIMKALYTNGYVSYRVDTEGKKWFKKI